MHPKQIDQFFKALDQELGLTADVILTGAAAGSLLGNIRPTLDIDFEIRVDSRSKRAAPEIIRGVMTRVQQKVGIAAQYSEDISHWSMIDFVDYRNKAQPYKKIGKLRIKIMAPAYWTLGKMARYFEVDIQDILTVLKKQKLKPDPLIALWAKALKRSPLSLHSGQFYDHVVDFISRYAKIIWGRDAAGQNLIEKFNKLAGIRK